MTVERHFAKNMELRALGGSGDADPLRLEGRAARYGTLSSDLNGFREVIDNGAFKSILASNPDVRCLFNHDPNQVLGRTTARTLALSEVSSGLAYRVELPPTQFARELHSSISRGDISGSSFGFSVRDDQQDWSFADCSDFDDDCDWTDEERTTGRFPLRVLRGFQSLTDVSPVTFPAYPSADVSARCLVPVPTGAPAEFRSLILRGRQTNYDLVRERRRNLFNAVLS